MLENRLQLARQRPNQQAETSPGERMHIRRLQNTNFRRNLLDAPQSAADIAGNLWALVRLCEIRFGPHLAVAKQVGLQVHEVLSESGVFRQRKILGDPDEQLEFEETARDLGINLFGPFIGYLQMYGDVMTKRIGQSCYDQMLSAVRDCFVVFHRTEDVKGFFQTFLRSMKKLHAALRIIGKITEVNGNMELSDALMLLDNAADAESIRRKTTTVLKYLAQIAPALVGMIPPETRKNGKKEITRTPQERMETVGTTVTKVQKNFLASSTFTYTKYAAIQRLEEELGRILMDLPFVSDSGETTMEERMFIFLGDSLIEGLRHYREQENKNPERLQWCEDFMQILAMLGEANANISSLLERKKTMNKRSLGKIIGYTSFVDLFGRLKAREFFPPEAIDKLLTAVSELEVGVETYLFGGTPEKLQTKLQNLSDAIVYFELAFMELTQGGYLPATPQKIQFDKNTALSPVFF